MMLTRTLPPESDDGGEGRNDDIRELSAAPLGRFEMFSLENLPNTRTLQFFNNPEVLAGVAAPPAAPKIKPGDFVLPAGSSPHENDVLSGRGNRINNHEGNKRFRRIIQEYKETYLEARKKVEKAHICANIVDRIRALGGRFLQQEGGLWVEVGDERARRKVGQALREDSSEIRAKIKGDVTTPSLPVPSVEFNKGLKRGSYCSNETASTAASTSVRSTRNTTSSRSSFNSRSSLVVMTAKGMNINASGRSFGSSRSLSGSDRETPSASEAFDEVAGTWFEQDDDDDGDDDEEEVDFRTRKNWSQEPQQLTPTTLLTLPSVDSMGPLGVLSANCNLDVAQNLTKIVEQDWHEQGEAVSNQELSSAALLTEKKRLLMSKRSPSFVRSSSVPIPPPLPDHATPKIANTVHKSVSSESSSKLDCNGLLLDKDVLLATRLCSVLCPASIQEHEPNILSSGATNASVSSTFVSCNFDHKKAAKALFSEQDTYSPCPLLTTSSENVLSIDLTADQKENDQDDSSLPDEAKFNCANSYEDSDCEREEDADEKKDISPKRNPELELSRSSIVSRRSARNRRTSASRASYSSTGSRRESLRLSMLMAHSRGARGTRTNSISIDELTVSMASIMTDENLLSQEWTANASYSDFSFSQGLSEYFGEESFNTSMQFSTVDECPDDEEATTASAGGCSQQFDLSARSLMSL